ncbi:MAG: hypothetical protein AB8I08_29920 [Sandaracinaceae bacterium]
MKHDSLRRLMRKIALGIPFAIPVITAPFNVGGCMLGYECAATPAPVVIEYEVSDAPLNCLEICGEDISCAATDAHHVQCDHVRVGQCGGAGRRPEAGLYASRGPRNPVTAWLHDTAVLEAGSVAAFEALADDLDRHGAPRFAARARVAAREESGHANLVNRLLHVRGVPSPTVRVPTSEPRSLFAIALENATEGCVGEAWGALEAHVQSERADDADVRGALKTIAIEEAAHALFSLDLAAWLRTRLTPEENREVERAAEAARDQLRQRLATRARPSGLGLLAPAEALALSA